MHAASTIVSNLYRHRFSEVHMALHFWAAPGAARKTASKTPNARKPPDRLSIIVGTVIAVLAIIGLILLLRGQLHF
jgi:hypothetical protein